ncbi:hybrid sensor histidine kinase/response regulator [Celeribacter indicus]|uniref:histidine kinase n=1 Tax=Celeribacter indicus TaxID=1208324 RepID=A0A0B5DXZ2_9RHOB|nr:response regulator [Celeribacter indicus]AJE45596.1 histidine kinase [Celeribacter indicus]SDW85004.1 CheY chemotaxis protein or a CheY-like REC (receiver) domain [Celeribacter indicus]
MGKAGARSHQSLLIEDAGRISLLSHDIRSVFAELQSGLTTLDQSAMPLPVRMDVSRLIHAGAHLGRLLNEVSQLVFDDHLQLAAPRTVANPRRTLTGLVQRWKRITAQLGSTLRLEGEETLPEAAELDVLALERVLSNLVSNALFHAGPGEILIRIDRQCRNREEEMVFRIRDSGPGYPAHVLREDRENSPIPIGSGEPGSGFGLRVAQDAVMRLGGTLLLHNPPEGGAEARLSLPLKRSPASRRLDRLPRGHRALLVEDSPALRFELRHDLETLGLEVIEAGDGSVALDILSAADADIDILFLDIELPLMSGMQLISTLKRLGRPLPPIIAVTSHVFAPSIAAIRALGVHDILSKPYPPLERIDRTVRAALGLDHAAPPAHAADPVPPQGLEALMRKLPPDFTRDFLSRLHQDFDRYLGQIGDMLDHEPTPQSRARLRHAAHALAGLFATAYARAPQERAARLSEQADQLPAEEMIALLRRLRQDVSDIQISIIKLLDSEITPNVAKTDFDR